ncbi:carbohydrate kinase [Mesorhizobium sp. Root157]|uniref:carbohydrate kinase family protein n=1 Tax=Mesorhizobium sp. Root157 TaxID=1736477 RepID=UPI0006FE20F3|nr:PfkB family carbohydrate kinase [Mesorhizobium sp. Root157]KQZ80814.1 carbohydrate kinase [Mesorhizobium sp. Root157]
MRPLAVIGNVNVDLIMGPVAPWPQSGTEIIVEHDELRVGGAAGNAALAWQALGVDFDIASNIGADQFGLWLRGAFAGYADKWPTCREGTTISVGITHPDGERTFFTTLGHLPRFSLADAFCVLDGDRLAGGYLLLCGSFLTPLIAREYDALFDWADRHDISVALDTGWPPEGWTVANKAITRHWLSRCRIALFNEIETTTLAGIGDPVEAAREIRSAMIEGATVVVKRGPQGAQAVGSDGKLFSTSAPAVDVVDTIGAGDVFNAAFLAGLAQGKTLAASLADGSQVASRAISTLPRSYGEVPDAAARRA